MVVAHLCGLGGWLAWYHRACDVARAQALACSASPEPMATGPPDIRVLHVAAHHLRTGTHVTIHTGTSEGTREDAPTSEPPHALNVGGPDAQTAPRLATVAIPLPNARAAASACEEAAKHSAP